MLIFGIHFVKGAPHVRDHGQRNVRKVAKGGRKMKERKKSTPDFHAICIFLQPETETATKNRANRGWGKWNESKATHDNFCRVGQHWGSGRVVMHMQKVQQQKKLHKKTTTTRMMMTPPTSCLCFIKYFYYFSFLPPHKSNNDNIAKKQTLCFCWNILGGSNFLHSSHFYYPLIVALGYIVFLTIFLKYFWFLYI